MSSNLVVSQDLCHFVSSVCWNIHGKNLHPCHGHDFTEAHHPDDWAAASGVPVNTLSKATQRVVSSFN